MAAKGLELVTLADVAKSADKKIGGVAEVLVEHNEMLNDVPYQVMNEKTIHKEDIRSALPPVYYRKANQPIPSGKTTNEERTFSAAHFESKSTMDTTVASRGGKDRIGYNRWNQAQGHLQSHAIELAELMIYGSPADSNLKTAGFFDIYSTLNPAEETSKQVIDGGGTGSDNTSILKVHWGERSIFGIYPEGTTAGLTRTDRSPGNKEVQIPGLDENGNPGNFWGFEENFLTDHGLVVKDFRQAGRICNISIADLKTGLAVNAADLTDLMIDLNFKIDSLTNGRGVWYVNRTIQAFLFKQAKTIVGNSMGLTFENYQGKEVLMFLGDPVRRMDAILNTEATVTV